MIRSLLINIWLISIIMLIILPNSPAYAQQPSKKYWWVDFGMGLQQPSKGLYMNGLFSVYFETQNRLVPFRSIGSGKITAEVFSPGYRSQDLYENAILYGFTHRNEKMMWSISGGLGVINGHSKNGNRYGALGLSLEIQHHLSAFSFLFLGVKGFGNINNQNSFGGLGFIFGFGKV